MNRETLWDKVLTTGYNIRETLINHPRKNNQSYFMHLVNALGYAIIILTSLIFLVIHAFMPCFFKETTTELLDDLIRKMKGR